MFQKSILFFFMLICVPLAYANEVKLEWQHYTSPPGAKEQLSDYALFKGNYQFDFTKNSFYFDSHFQLEYGLDRSEFSYFNIPELYLDYKYDLERPLYSIRSVQVSLGRKAESWSFGDEYWDLGLWNPMNRWNPLHPSDNGLVGSFFTFKSDQWESNFFIGAVYLPDKEVQIIEKESSIYSRSRWFSMLSSQVRPFNINIYYSTDKPFIFDVLFQQSFLCSLKTWSKTPKVFYWIKWSFADKPVNHLFHILNTNNSLLVEEKEGGKIFARPDFTIFPVRQRIVSTEWGLDYKQLSMTFSLENTRMKPASILPKDWNFIKDQADFTYFSAVLRYNYLKGSFLRFAFIQSWFMGKTDSQRVPSIVERGKVLEGMGFDWQTHLFSGNRQPLFFNLKYQYSFLDKGAWLFAKTVYYMTPKIYTEMKINVLGAFAQLNNTFLGKYKHNDYYAWSLAYDF